MAKEKEDDEKSGSDHEIIGYRQQPGKLPFSRPGWTTLPVYVFGLIRKGVTPLINSISVIMLVSSMLLVGLSLLAERTRRGG